MRLAAVLIAFQQEDGSWPYRVSISDGAIVETYTGAAIMPLLLLEQVEVIRPSAEITSAINRGIDWILQHPVQDGHWQQMYEDVRTQEPYANLEQWAALETAMFLLRRNHLHSLEIARRLVQFVEDQFVIFGDDPVTLIPYRPFVPANMEQYTCYWPMDIHTANYVRATLALYEAAGDIDWARKAVAAANTIVRCQHPDGHLSTVVPDSRLRSAPSSVGNWFNCMAHAADVLLTLGPRLAGIAKKEERSGQVPAQ